MRHILEQNCTHFFEQCGITNAMIGISGGVDSAVTLAIAVSSLGKENVHALLMPYKLGMFSSYENFEDAKSLCQEMGVKYTVHEIDEMASHYESIFSDMAFGNTLARIRMTLLFGYANTENALVLGTCNKTETMLGYETKFGDGAADVSIIGNLWKHEVYALAEEYNLPKRFSTKTPSAELQENHSDEEEMGFTYAQADSTLAKIENGETQFSLPIEQKIYALYLASHHKRSPLPTLSLS